jgi:hypothetical protein
MEVHKHPHHVTHKKKWTEYLLEFFMLFLAVFLGFLVENFREHKVELERTEKHMHTMVENLKYDTIRYGVNLRNNLITCSGLDSFRYYISEAIEGRIDANRLYYYYWKVGRNYSYPVTNDAAMSQLKSSGMLRMVKNDSLVNQMGDYYGRILNTLDNARSLVNQMGDYYGRILNTLDNARATIIKRRDQLYESYRLFFSLRGFDLLLQRDTMYQTGNNSYVTFYYDNILKRDPPLKLLNTLKVNFELLYNDVALYELAIRGFDAYMRYCHQTAEGLLKHIKEEYNFKNE